MHRISWTLLTALIAVLVYLAWSALSPAEAATLTVNTTEFTDDGVCDALPTGDCTLREAILLAGSGDTIAFNIPAASDPGCNAGTGVCVIKPTTTVPVITDPGVTIDGYTQPGASRNTLTSGSDAAIKIEVDMSLAASVSAFGVDAADVEITGFAVSHLSNGSSAVKLEDDGDNAIVQGNFLGLDASGTQAGNVLNSSHGIVIDAAASSALIGGPSPGDRNVFGETQEGVWVLGGGGHTIQNNYFGSNAAGTSLLQHSQAIYLAGSGANVVTGNHISSDGTGVLVSSDGNTISGNVFGLGADGVTRLGNTTAIDILGSDNMIGGLTAPEGNLIGGINYNGISVRGGDGNQVAANVIGLNAVGGVSGGEYGLVVDAGTDTLIGGGQFAARNVISGNDVGVYVAPNADSVTIRRNYIGTDYAGGSAVPNRIGVLVQNLSPGSIGTTPRVLVDLNVISGNTDDGVAVTGGAALTVVQRNWIGVNRQLDTAIPNGKNGVVGHADGTVIGGPTGLVGNVIGFNGEDGVRIPLLYDPFDRGPSGGLPSPFTGNVTALKNSIFSNGGLGIDIAADGPHANDAGDGDGGPNGQQNAPVLTAAVVGSTIITGTLDSAPNRDFRLELFTSNNCDASGFGEGGLYAGQTTLHTDGDGQIEFFVASPADAQVGDFVTATVTDLTSGATSEFSNCVTVVAAGSPTPTPTGQTPTPTPIVVETPEPSAEVTDEPTPTPSPTPTPTPTPTTTAGPTGSPTATTASQTPSPEPTGSDILRMGDNECSGDVSARDPLWTLLSLAGLGRDGFGDCPEVGDDFGAIWGDVNCDGLLDGDDVVAVLLWLSGLDVPQEAGCPEIGEEINF